VVREGSLLLPQNINPGRLSAHLRPLGRPDLLRQTERVQPRADPRLARCLTVPILEEASSSWP
jgi:hypothetical protein